MAQFDVYISPGRNRAAAPFVVDVQSRRHELAATRLVIPLLSDLPRRPGAPDLDLLPEFRIAGQRVFLHPLEMQAIDRRRLGSVVASLAGDNDSALIIAAIDLVITRAYG